MLTHSSEEEVRKQQRTIIYTIQTRSRNERDSGRPKRRSAHPRAGTQNASTNDYIGYLKGQENPDIHLLSLRIMYQ